jgi:xanthine/uracil permease
MSSFGGRKILLYLLLGPCFGSLFMLMRASVFGDEHGLILTKPIDSFFIGLMIGIIPFLLITLFIAIFDAFLKRVPVYVPFVCSIIPFLLVWGFEIRMLGDAPKDYLVDLPPALMLTIVPSMIVWSIIRVTWGPVSK